MAKILLEELKSYAVQDAFLHVVEFLKVIARLPDVILTLRRRCIPRIVLGTITVSWH